MGHVVVWLGTKPMNLGYARNAMRVDVGCVQLIMQIRVWIVIVVLPILKMGNVHVRLVYMGYN